MPPEELEVDVEAVRGVGKAVTHAGGTLREAVTAAGSGLAPPPAPNSAAGAAAAKADDLWLAALQRLVGRIGEFGTGLTTAAQDYRATDQENADDIRRSGVNR